MKTTIRQLQGAEMLNALYTLNQYSLHPSPPYQNRDEWEAVVRERKGVTSCAAYEDEAPVSIAASTAMTQNMRGKLFPTPKPVAQSSFLISLILLLVACSNVTVTPQATVTALPPATLTSIPTITATLELQQLPACTFPLTQTTMEESTPEEYAFSEPRAVTTFNTSVDIMEWLPDSQRILITRLVPNNGKSISNENIELFNPQTGETHIYAKRQPDMWNRPVWARGLDAVIYPDFEILKSTKSKSGMNIPPYEFQRSLWLSRGDPNNVQLIESNQLTADGAFRYSVVSKPDGSQILYRAGIDKQLKIHTVVQGALKVGDLISFGANQNYDMVWRPNASQIFFYSFASPTVQAFLLDVDTVQSCTLIFKEWIYMARWSPNGRYLAAITSQSPQFPISENYNLVVLDTVTGNLYQIDSTMFGPPEMKNCCRHVVEDFSWAPDNQRLAVIGTAGFTGTNTYTPISRLYLVDFLSGDVDNLFPSHEFISNHFGSSLSWSPDGTKILTICYQKMAGLCLIPVRVNEKK